MHTCWPIVSVKIDTLRLAHIMTITGVVGAIISILVLTHTTSSKSSSTYYSLSEIHASVIVAFSTMMAFCFVLILTTFVTIQLVWRYRSSAVRNASQSDQHTAMVMYMIIIFILLKQPFVVSFVVWVKADEPSEAPTVYLNNCMDSVNSSVNLFIYLATSKDFRREFVGVLKRR